MNPFLIDYIDCLTNLHTDMRSQIEALPDLAFDWSPGLEMNTITILVNHSLGAERFWIGEVAGGVQVGRVRDEEFLSANQTSAELITHIDKATAFAEEIVSSLQPSDFGRKRQLANHDRSCTVGWALLHALEHTAQHCGHIQQIRQLWEQQ